MQNSSLAEGSEIDLKLRLVAKKPFRRLYIAQVKPSLPFANLHLQPGRMFRLLIIRPERQTNPLLPSEANPVRAWLAYAMVRCAPFSKSRLDRARRCWRRNTRQAQCLA